METAASSLRVLCGTRCVREISTRARNKKAPPEGEASKWLLLQQPREVMERAAGIEPA